MTKAAYKRKHFIAYSFRGRVHDHYDREPMWQQVAMMVLGAVVECLPLIHKQEARITHDPGDLKAYQ